MMWKGIRPRCSPLKVGGLLAERIIELARQSGVYVQEDAQLVQYLAALDLYQEIPPQLYEVVAEVLAFVYRMDKDYR